MEKTLYVMFIERGKLHDKMTKAAAERHVENLRRLDDAGQLVLCGPLTGFPGIEGMVILKAQSLAEAEGICAAEPLVAEGYAAYRLCALQVADRDNGYLL